MRAVMHELRRSREEEVRSTEMQRDRSIRLQHEIDSYEQRTRDASDKLRRESGNLSGPAKPEKLKLDPAQEEKLRALGYLN